MAYPYHKLYISHELSTIAYLSIYHEASIHLLYGLSSYISIYHEPFIPFTMSPSFYPSILHPSLHLDLVFSFVIGIKHKVYPNCKSIDIPKTFQKTQKKSKHFKKIQKKSNIQRKIQAIWSIQSHHPKQSTPSTFNQNQIIIIIHSSYQ